MITESQEVSPVARLQDVGHRTAQETVVDTLRQAILSGLLAGGKRLVQAEIGEQLGVSTTPVREAMRELAAEGLIRFDPYRGAVVHTPTVDEVREVYELRLLLEPVAMRKVMVHITAAELARAGELQKKMEQVQDAAGWAMLNRGFHGALLEAARSPRLLAVIDRLVTDATGQVALSIKADPRRISEGNKEHRRILRALGRRDSASVERLVIEHLRSTVGAIEHLEANTARGLSTKEARA